MKRYGSSSIPKLEEDDDAPASRPETSFGTAIDDQLRIRPGHRRVHALVESVDSTPEQVRCALLRVASALGELGVAEDDRHAIEVVLAECMNNVVEHALGDRPECHFDLKLFLCGDSLFCRVEDDGEPMPDLTLPIGDKHDLSVDLQDLPEGGFGWFLIRELTQDLHYERACDRNSLSFNIQLGQTGQ